MILQKDFYFIRHGQTDDNTALIKKDRHDISLNAVGCQQAKAAEPLIANLPIRSICCSPLKRAKETKEIISINLKATHHEIKELTECSLPIWRDMTACQTAACQTAACQTAACLNSRAEASPEVNAFKNRVLQGINLSLAHEEAVLIVAHGGIHWILCCLLDIKNHDWIAPNSIPIHFSISPEGHWQAKTLLN